MSPFLFLSPELVEEVFNSLELRDRVSLASCCGTLRRQELTSETVWQTVAVSFTKAAQPEQFAAWLLRRRHQVVHLMLTFESGVPEHPVHYMLGVLTGAGLKTLSLSTTGQFELGFWLAHLPQLRRLCVIAAAVAVSPSLADVGLPAQLRQLELRKPSAQAVQRLLGCRLQHLQRLSLEQMGQVADLSGLSQLTGLTHLGLPGNRLRALPEQLSLLTSLMSLSMQRNFLHDGDGGLRHLGGLSKLRKLRIEASRLASPLPEALLSRLEVLGLFNCPNAPQLPTAPPSCPLKELYIDLEVAARSATTIEGMDSLARLIMFVDNQRIPNKREVAALLRVAHLHRTGRLEVGFIPHAGPSEVFLPASAVGLANLALHLVHSFPELSGLQL